MNMFSKSFLYAEYKAKLKEKLSHYRQFIVTFTKLRFTQTVLERSKFTIYAFVKNSNSIFIYVGFVGFCSNLPFCSVTIPAFCGKLICTIKFILLFSPFSLIFQLFVFTISIITS